VWDRYRAALAPYADEHGFTIMETPAERTSAYHMFYVLLDSRDRRNAVLGSLREEGVQATFHYVPLHSSDAGRRFAARETECPVTDDISGRLLRLPFYNNLSAPEADRVVEAFLAAVSADEPA
jgi:dTDP-4-amino-4,6-dideoxygalactose transaminase